MPGQGFLADIIKAAEAANWPAYRVLAAACVVSKYANRALGDRRRLYLDEWTEASAFVSRLEPFSRQRNRLTDILIALDDDPSHEDANKQMLVLAHELHGGGHYASAADVFLLVQRNACCVDTKLEALRQRAFMCRLLHRWDEATALYQDLALRAVIAGRADMRLHAELGLACVAMERGNTSLALLKMNAVIVNAREAGNELIEAKGLIGRARIFGTRRDPRAAELDCLAALALLEDQAERERCLVNLGWAQREQGNLVSAIDTACTVARQSRDPERRASAQLLLFQLAVDTGDLAAREDWRGQLDGQPLRPDQEMIYHRTVSIERATDDNFPGAIDSAALMLAAAERNNVPELIMQAEKAIAELRVGRIPAVYDYRPPTALRRPAGPGRFVDPLSARRDVATAGIPASSEM